MAFPAVAEAASTRASSALDDGDDYGSDWSADGEALLAGLVDDAAQAAWHDETAQDDVAVGIAVDDGRERGLGHFAVVPLAIGNQGSLLHSTQETPVERSISVVRDESPGKIQFERHDTNTDVDNDTRSPLQRFRTAPKKPLSVTDLVSPAWCELQYWYSLTKHGRKLRTPAMERGSSIHKVLEEQVHRVVPVDVQTREDHWGLRVWNIIQGLRTLRATGMTRELEVWGTIDGQVVNGVIDELSYTCPDPELEAAIVREETKSAKKNEIPADQQTISQFFASQSDSKPITDALKDHPSRHAPAKKVYLTDVKTRNHKSLPKGPSLRPTQLQLMLYRTLLSRMASSEIDAQHLFDRYRVNPAVTFSDSLLAQLSSLDYDSEISGTQESVDTNSDPLSEIVAHNTLDTLWALMLREFRHTFPLGDASLSRVLRAEFRNAASGEVLGARTFVHDQPGLDAYLAAELAWWRGERPARGVEVDEAYKCRSCEHAAGCAWRLDKIEQATQVARRRRGKPAERSS